MENQGVTREDIGTTVIDTRTGKFGEVVQVWPLSRIADVSMNGALIPVPFEHCC
jgi:hypothetical protein